MSERDELLDIKQAAAFLSVSETSLRRWTNEGLLRCLRIGRRRERRFRRSDLLAFMEVQPARGTRGSSAAGDSAAASVGATGRGGHVCMLYSTTAGRTRLAVSFLAAGLSEGDQCYLISDPAMCEQIVGGLRRDHPELRAAIDEGGVALSGYATSVEAQLAFYAAEFASATKHGRRSLRVIGDAGYLASNVTFAELLEYEAKYDRLARQFDVTTACQYDVRRFTGGEVLAALRGHRDTLSRPAEALLE
jgi:excisionase family DNA binding protein